MQDTDADGTPANAGETRRVSDYAASSGTLTVTGPNLASEDEAIDIDLYRHFHPTDILRAYNRARQLVWPQIGIVRDIETLVTGNLQVAYAVPSTMRRIHRIQLGRRYEAVNTAENLLLAGHHGLDVPHDPDLGPHELPRPVVGPQDVRRVEVPV